MVPVLTFGQRQQAMRGLPFYGKGDWNFVASQSNFSNGIAIKMLPLSDLSRPQNVNIDQFDVDLKQLSQMFKKGGRIGGIKVNSTFTNKKREPESVIGRFDSFKIDRKNKTIRAFIMDPDTMKLVEVYPETLSRLTESKDLNGKAKTFLEFVI
jgi:hypothetical protein